MSSFFIYKDFQKFLKICINFLGLVPKISVVISPSEGGGETSDKSLSSSL